MKKTDAHAFATQIFSDYFATLPKSAQMGMKSVMEEALKVLAPVPDTVAVGDPPGATNG